MAHRKSRKSRHSRKSRKSRGINKRTVKQMRKAVSALKAVIRQSRKR